MTVPTPRPETVALDAATVLLPCPFCGGGAGMQYGPPGCDYVKCGGCCATSDDGSEERAIAAWNRRVPLARQALPEPAGEVTDAQMLEWLDLAGYERAGSPLGGAQLLASFVNCHLAVARLTPATDALAAVREETMHKALTHIAKGYSPMGLNGVPSSAEIARRALAGEEW